MSKTDIKKTKFTPLFQSVTDDLGVIASAVFGRIHQYCQMSEGYCYAPQDKIGEWLRLSRKTVNVHIEKLVRGGYLDDCTQNTKGRTRIYKDTGKAGFPIRLKPVTVPVTEVVTAPVTILPSKIVKKEKKLLQPVGVVDSSNSNSRTNSKTGYSLKEVLGSGLSASPARKDKEAEFLSTASDEQKRAYKLAKQVSGIDKAIEKATSETPMESAISLLEWHVEKETKNARIAQKLLAKIEEEAQQLQPTRQLRREDVIDMNGI